MELIKKHNEKVRDKIIQDYHVLVPSIAEMLFGLRITMGTVNRDYDDLYCTGCEAVSTCPYSNYKGGMQRPSAKYCTYHLAKSLGLDSLAESINKWWETDTVNERSAVH